MTRHDGAAVVCHGLSYIGGFLPSMAHTRDPQYSHATPQGKPQGVDHDLLHSPALAAGVLVLPALATLGLSAVLALAAPTEAQARTRRSVEHNADGSTTTHTGVARSGPNGAMLLGRTATTDGQGNGSVTRRGATVGAQGGVAARQG